MLSKTFHSRLIIFSLLLIIFLSGTLLYSHYINRDTFLREALEHQHDVARAEAQLLEKDLANLIQQTKLISRDAYLRDYIHLAGQNGDTGPLHRLIQQTYNWLPYPTRLVFSHNGHTLVGKEHNQLATEIASRLPINKSHQFYLNNDGLVYVAVEPIYRQGKMIGTFAMAHSLKKNWQAWQQKHTDQTIFISQNNTILYSSRSALTDKPFNPEQNHTVVDNEAFTLYPVMLPQRKNTTPSVWIGFSDTHLRQQIDGRYIVMIISIATPLILFASLTMSRLFAQPLASLSLMIQQIALGKTPEARRTKPRTEAEALKNHILDMVQVFRTKQQQVDGAHQQLQKSAITDTLTGLYNRRHLQDIYPKLLAQARRDRRTITAILCDLDYFKRLNDTYGHLAGDRALEQFASILKSHSRSNDFLYRLGGEEFLILSIGEERDGGKILAEKIRSAISTHPIVFQRQMIPITVSCGVCAATAEGSAEASLQRLLANADKALYQAKETGRNKVCYFDERAAAPATAQKSKSAV